MVVSDSNNINDLDLCREPASGQFPTDFCATASRMSKLVHPCHPEGYTDGTLSFPTVHLPSLM